MADRQFTPGPWRVEPEGVNADVDGSEYLVAVTDEDSELRVEEMDANARLIAAAPDLYEACEAALPLLEDEREVLFNSHRNPATNAIEDEDAAEDIRALDEAIAGIRDALAKAEDR